MSGLSTIHKFMGARIAHIAANPSVLIPTWGTIHADLRDIAAFGWRKLRWIEVSEFDSDPRVLLAYHLEAETCDPAILEVHVILSDKASPIASVRDVFPEATRHEDELSSLGLLVVSPLEYPGVGNA